MLRRPLAAARAAALVMALALTGCVDGPDEPGDPRPSEEPIERDHVAPAGEADDAAIELFDAVCEGRAEVEVAGAAPEGLTSVSGLAASRRHTDVLWAVEDSFEPPEVTALDHTGRELARIRLEGAALVMNVDWEALAVGPGPDGEPWIHVADIGDNLGVRTELRIFRFPEPELADARLTPEVVTVRHEDGRPNAEAMAVDAEGEVWVIDKVPGGGPATVLHLDDDGVLRSRGTVGLPGEEVTGLDISRDGTVAALRTNLQLRLHRVGDDQDLAGALADQEGCATPPPPERQGESVAIAGDGSALFTVSEDESGAPVDLHATAP